MIFIFLYSLKMWLYYHYYYYIIITSGSIRLIWTSENIVRFGADQLWWRGFNYLLIIFIKIMHASSLNAYYELKKANDILMLAFHS